MRKLISLALLLSPLLAGLAFPAVGDTVIYDNVRYIITSETDSTSTYEMSLYQILEAPRIVIPDKITYGGHTYEVTSISEDNMSIYPQNLERDVYIDKIDFSLAAHIDTFPMSATWTGCTDIDTLILPPNLNYAAEFYALCSTEGYDEKESRYLGIKRLFSSGTTDIDIESFQSCYSLVEVDLSTTAIDSIPGSPPPVRGMFDHCYWLEEVKLPETVRFLDGSTFAFCTRLNSVRFLGSVVSYIGQSAFAYCIFLDSLDLSAQTRLKTISASLCNGCTSLRSVLLPPSVDSIGRSAFSGCVSLSEIEVPVLDPIPVEENVFSGVDKSSCRLIVPAPSIGKYRAAPVWRDFLNIESGDLLTITVLSADSLMGGVTGTGVYRYGDNPYIAANPARGYRFTRWSDGSTEQYRRLTLTSDSTITAYFEFDPEFQYRVSVRTADRTMGSVSPTTAYARHGETVTITATPLSGYRFTLWSDSVTANPRDIIVTRDTVLTAHFAPYTPDTFAVTLLCDSAMGTVSGSGRYPEGTAATLTATPHEGYAFTRWEDSHGLTFTDNPLTLTVTCDTLLTALFREDGTGHAPADDDGCAAWVTPDGTLRVRCPGCRLMELRTVTGLTLYSGAPADIPLPMPGIYILTLDGRTIKIIRP